MLHLQLEERINLALGQVALAEELMLRVQRGQGVEEPPQVGHPALGGHDALAAVLELLLNLLVELLHEYVAGRWFWAGPRLEV